MSYKEAVAADVGDTSDRSKEAGETKVLQKQTTKEKYADVTLRLAEEYGHIVLPLTPEGDMKLNKKLYLHMMLLICAINLVMFVSAS